jgi:hypothetical protein
MIAHTLAAHGMRAGSNVKRCGVWVEVAWFSTAGGRRD